MRNKYLGVALFLLVAEATAFANIENTSAVYPIPVIEMGRVIGGWLASSGYTVRKNYDRTNMIKLTGEKDGQDWVIVLKPHSPLATHIQATFSRRDQVEKDWYQKLATFIDRYIDDALSEIEPSTAENNNSNQTIPISVLKNMETIVCIKAIADGSEIQFSGFVIDPEGLIICTAHDLKRLNKITVSLLDGREIVGQVIKMDTRRDLVLLKVDFKFDKFIPVVKGKNWLGLGEKIFTVGCPLNLKGSVYHGIINGPPRKTDGLTLWQANMKIYPGSSGGPVFDFEGNLVAIVKGRYRGTDSVGFLIPFETIVQFLADM